MRDKYTANRMEQVLLDLNGPLLVEANKMQNKGIDVLKLNIGNPAIFGMQMPDSIRNAIINQMDLATPYSEPNGIADSIVAIREYETKKKGLEGLTDDDIFITNGVSEAADIIMACICEVGDEVLIPMPSYALWTNEVKMYSGKPVFYTCDENANWFPDVEDIRRKVNSRTKAIILVNPNNPTGAVYSDDVLLDIIDIARKNNLIIISDEIYDRLCMDDVKHTSVAKIAKDIPVITCNGLSKSHIVCGFRCGWLCVTGPKKEKEEIVKNILKIAALRLCSNALGGIVIKAALEDDESTRKMFIPGGEFYERREATCKALSECEDFSFVKPKTAFYIFPKIDAKKHNIISDKKFVLDCLHKTHILLMPGSAFDMPAPDHFRICMLPKGEVLYDAIHKIQKFLDSYKQ